MVMSIDVGNRRCLQGADDGMTNNERTSLYEPHNLHFYFHVHTNLHSTKHIT